MFFIILYFFFFQSVLDVTEDSQRDFLSERRSGHLNSHRKTDRALSSRKCLEWNYCTEKGGEVLEGVELFSKTLKVLGFNTFRHQP